jgi:hypothetical protein
MLQRNRLQVSGVFVAVPLLALAALAVLTWNQSGSTVLFPRWAGDESGVPVEQVGEDTFENPLSTESSADVAAKIQQVLVSSPHYVFCLRNFIMKMNGLACPKHKE